jgi:hypothetical protein
MLWGPPVNTGEKQVDESRCGGRIGGRYGELCAEERVEIDIVARPVKPDTEYILFGKTCPELNSPGPISSVT